MDTRAVLILALTVGLAACGSTDPPAATPPDPTPAAASPGTPATTVAAAPPATLSAPDAALVDRVEAGVEALLSAPAVELSVVVEDEEGVISTADATVDNVAGHLRSHQLSGEGGGSIVTERIVLDEEMFVRIYQAAEEQPEWSRIEIDGSLQDEFVSEAYMAFGMMGPSFDRVLELARNVPVEVRDLGRQIDGGRSADVVQLVFVAEDIRRYLSDNALELVGPFAAEGSTMLEFWLDGELVSLAGAGTQFFDGEAIEGDRISVEYQAVDGAEVAVSQE